MSAETKIEELGIVLPPRPKAAGLYKLAVVAGNMCYVSGHISMNHDGTLITGCVGADVDESMGYSAARHAGLAVLATLKH